MHCCRCGGRTTGGREAPLWSRNRECSTTLQAIHTSHISISFWLRAHFHEYTLSRCSRAPLSLLLSSPPRRSSPIRTFQKIHTPIILYHYPFHIPQSSYCALHEPPRPPRPIATDVYHRPRRPPSHTGLPGHPRPFHACPLTPSPSPAPTSSPPHPPARTTPRAVPEDNPSMQRPCTNERASTATDPGLTIVRLTHFPNPTFAFPQAPGKPSPHPSVPDGRIATGISYVK
jgi:hypothetical protein